MKRFFGIVGTTVSVLCAILLGCATAVVGFRILSLLTKGIISVVLCLEFVGIVVLLGAFAAVVVLLSPVVDPALKEASKEPYKPTGLMSDPDE